MKRCIATGSWFSSGRTIGLLALLTLVGLLALAPTADAGRFYPESCKRHSSDLAIRSNPPRDAWRYTRAYPYPFPGWTPHGRGRIIWRRVAGTKKKKHYPAPNLPSCRVGRFGTEDRATRKSGKHFKMLLPVEGQLRYELKDTFDRRVATIAFHANSPISGRPSKWGWYVNGHWAGHSAKRAFEAQGEACKLVAENGRWVRDPRYMMVAFNPSLGSPGHRTRPRRTMHLRVRAFIDRRAVPERLRDHAERFDFGCGATELEKRKRDRRLGVVRFRSGVTHGAGRLRGYYFGEATQLLYEQPRGKHLYNHYPLRNYNTRPQFHYATYAMINSTGVAAGGMVRGIVRSRRDRFARFDEMRYCDPNYTLRPIKLKRGRHKLKRSRFFLPVTYRHRNRPAVRWVYGRIDPDPATLTSEQALAAKNPLSEQLFAWMPIRCRR